MNLFHNLFKSDPEQKAFPDYVQIIRSRRRSFSLEIKDGNVLVRAPISATDKVINRLLSEKSAWIDHALAADAAKRTRAQEEGPLTEAEVAALKKQAKQYIPQRAAYYADIIGVSYGQIAIRLQKTRWGSCSSKGNLNFNCLLMLTPPEVIDSVVVHELCHRKEMNHSARFYALVRSVYPDYDRCSRWLKANGGVLLRRAQMR